MRILLVHPVMTFLGGGERLCCETIRALASEGHELTILSETFDPQRVESFFGYGHLFDRVNMMLYPSSSAGAFGTSSHLLKRLRYQDRTLRDARRKPDRMFDLIFSTQDAGYIPDISLPVIQWGYFPRSFSYPHSLPKTIRSLPLRLHYERKISRIGLVLAISQYSKLHFEKDWKRPTTLIYPSCNMVSPGAKRNLVVTVARAVPEKRLELFWEIARQRPQYEFAMLLTQEARYLDYSKNLAETAPSNGRAIFNLPKEEYHKFLGEAKVYLHLMPGEHFGITVVEAMSASCIPIVHDSGGPKEIVDEGSGFRWQKIDDVPRIIDGAMARLPSAHMRRRAEYFNYERFEKGLSSIFSELQA